jgi:hypothetical protein
MRLAGELFPVFLYQLHLAAALSLAKSMSTPASVVTLLHTASPRMEESQPLINQNMSAISENRQRYERREDEEHETDPTLTRPTQPPIVFDRARYWHIHRDAADDYNEIDFPENISIRSEGQMSGLSEDYQPTDTTIRNEPHPAVTVLVVFLMLVAGIVVAAAIFGLVSFMVRLWRTHCL